MTSPLELINYFVFGGNDRRRKALPTPRSLIPLDDIPTDPAAVWGCDFSGQWDGKPDMAKYKARGARFVIFKAADGTLKSKYIDENVANAKAQGLVVGVYFWLYRNIRVSGTAQANAWWNIVKGMDLDFYGIDFEWTKWMGQPDNPETSDLWGAAKPFSALAGTFPYIYSAPGYLSEYFNHSDLFKSFPLWIAHYGVLRPDSIQPWGNNGHTFWQCTDHWPGAELGVDPAWSKAEDGNIYNGSVEDFIDLFGTNEQPDPEPQPEPQPEPDAYIVKKVLSEIELCTTPTYGILPLKSVTEHAAENGWFVCMNAGAGFDYLDKYRAVPRTSGFESFTQDGKKFYYSRQMITEGKINPELSDNPNTGPWCIIGFSEFHVWFVITTGLEGTSTAKTQMQAAVFAQSLGIRDAYLLDSGRSAQIEENGAMVYWPYGPDEKVPVAIGMKSKEGDAMTVKGVVVKGDTTIKATKVGEIPKETIMHIGWYAYASVVGSQSTGDLYGFDHCYNEKGERLELGTMCKAFAGNMQFFNESEPLPSPTPEPTPTPTATRHIIVNFDVDEAGNVTNISVQTTVSG